MPKHRPAETMEDVVARFWLMVARCRHRHPCPRCCWPWEGRRDTDGYGSFAFRLQHYPRVVHLLAHRFVLEWAAGAGCLFFPNYHVRRCRTPFVVMHRCNNKSCCNPAHLFLGTIADNVRDAREQRRIARALHVPLDTFMPGDEVSHGQ